MWSSNPKKIKKNETVKNSSESFLKSCKERVTFLKGNFF